MQIALKAATSPSKDDAKESDEVQKKQKETDRDRLEDQPMTVVELKELPSQLDGTAAVGFIGSLQRYLTC